MCFPNFKQIIHTRFNTPMYSLVLIKIHWRSFRYFYLVKKIETQLNTFRLRMLYLNSLDISLFSQPYCQIYLHVDASSFTCASNNWNMRHFPFRFQLNQLLIFSSTFFLYTHKRFTSNCRAGCNKVVYIKALYHNFENV